MTRFGRLHTAARAIARTARLACSQEERQLGRPAASLLQTQQTINCGGWAPALLRKLHTSLPAWQDVAPVEHHATGLERLEVEARAKGIDPFHEDWLDAPFGTEDKPVQVTSAFSERVVGVPDPYDDSIVWWGHIVEGEPPKQIIEGGEFFVLKRVPDEDAHGH